MRAKKQIGVDKFYKAVYEICKREGLIDVLDDHRKESESTRFNQRVISKKGLHILDAVQCVYDKKRTKFFLKEIKDFVRPGMRVIEAGLGTGVLASYAQLLGAHVIGLEINKNILSLARRVQSRLSDDLSITINAKFDLANAILYKSSDKADVIISENIYTGMFYEKQVHIMNNMRSLLKEGGVVIPATMTSYIALSHCSFSSKVKNKDMHVLQDAHSLKPVRLSKYVEYDSIDFRSINNDRVEFSQNIKIERSGIINGLLIYSDVGLPSGKMIGKKDTTFLNNEIVLAVSPEITVKRNDTVRLALSYEYGAKPTQATINLVII